MDEFEEYILDQIQDYRSEREQSERKTNECLIGELLDALVKYRVLKEVRDNE